MSQSIEFLKPTYYVQDEQLKTVVRMISTHKQEGGLKGHALAVAKAVHSIALVIFISIPYHLALGSKNLFLNCVHLNLKYMVLGHYNAALQGFAYSVIATVYVTIGIFVPPVLNGFKMEESQPDDSNIPPDSSSIAAENHEEPKRSPTISFAQATKKFNEQPAHYSPQNHTLKSLNPSLGINSLSITEDQSEFIVKESLQTPSDFVSSMPSVESDMEVRRSLTPSFKEEGIEVSIQSGPHISTDKTFCSFSLSDKPSTDFHTSFGSRAQNGNEHDSISFQQLPSQTNSISTSSFIETSLDSSLDGDWEMIPNVQSSEVVSVEASGANLENQAHRIALNEYIRILWDDFKIDPNEKLTTIESWLKSPVYKDNLMIKALYCTLCYLTIQPIAYGNESLSYNNAKEQYIAYVSSLRRALTTKEFQEIRKGSNIKELKDCLTLIRALCQARFLSENHGFLRSLLQLHEEEYNCKRGERKILVTRENFAHAVILTNEKVNQAPASMEVPLIQKNTRKALGAIGYEDFLMTDLSFWREKQIFVNDKGEERSFNYMRHPTPHVEGSLAWIALGAMSRTIGLGHIESGEAIAPEFEVMLEAIAERGESYFIQSHQRLNDLHILENEDSRSQTLYRLQESHKNFHVVFQAVEGDLFDHGASYAKITTFADLKKAIKASFYHEKNPNRLPACLEKNKEYPQVIDQLLEQVHQTLFGGRVDISFDEQDSTQPDYPNREWQAFILAFYILQGDDLKFRLPAIKYFCTNCKNFFDRGGGRAMAEDRLHQEMSKREVTTEDLEAIIVSLVPVPLQSKGQGVIEKRLKPGLALERILVALEDKKSLQEIEFGGGYKFDRFEVSKREQRAIPLITTDVQLKKAQTLEEIKEVFRPLQGKSYRVNDNDIVQKNWMTYQGEGRGHLFDQIDKDLKRSKVYVDRTCYDARESHNAKAIFEYLKECGIDEDIALKAMAQMQQGIFVELTGALTTELRHENMDLSITDSPEKNTIYVTITKDNITIEAQNRLLYKITNPAHARAGESIATFDTTVLVTIPKDGSASKGHWTWEVTEILA